jgi:hypothetical protein
VQAIDPQLYVAPLRRREPEETPRSDLFAVPMRPRDFSARSLVPLVEGLIEFQARRPVTQLLSPTVALASMVDRWAGVAAKLADTSLDTWSAIDDERPLLLAVAYPAESCWQTPTNVDRLLDVLVGVRYAKAFYLLIEINPRTDPGRRPSCSSERFTSSTPSRGERVHGLVGYAGLNGFAYRAAGAGIRRRLVAEAELVVAKHWTAGGGGRAPRARILPGKILGSLLIDNELRLIARQRTDTDLLADILDVPVRSRGVRCGKALRRKLRPCRVDAQLFAVCSALAPVSRATSRLTCGGRSRTSPVRRTVPPHP